jgi:hypothetical protein
MRIVIRRESFGYFWRVTNNYPNNKEVSMRRIDLFKCVAVKGNTTRGIFKKIAMVAASDATVAATGTVYGAGFAGGKGAAIGAVIAGGASSADGWNKEKLCVTVLMSKIQEEIRKQSALAYNQ